MFTDNIFGNKSDTTCPVLGGLKIKKVIQSQSHFNAFQSITVFKTK